SLPNTLSLSSTKQRHTARQHAIEGRITYPFHPRCGETAVILKRFAFRGVEVIATPHPDGAIVWIPAWMMDASAAHYELCKEPRVSIDILRSLRAEVDALLGFLQSDSETEKDKDEATIPTSPKRPVRRGRAPAPCRTGGRTNGGAGNPGRSPTARDRGSAGKRGARR